MNLQSGKYQWLENYKKLRLDWQKTNQAWDDAKAQEFHTQYLRSLERYVKVTSSSLDELDEVFRRIKEDCF